VALVVALMRKNMIQDVAAAFFGISQPTASRRWDLLRPLIGEVLAEFVPDPRQVIGKGSVLVDGTICPTWDWSAIPDLYSGKAGYPGMNIQIATDLDGQIVAISTTPVHGARHDAHAYAASGLAHTLTDLHTVADLGYTGVDGIDLMPIKNPEATTSRPLHVQHPTIGDPSSRRTRSRPRQNMAHAQRGRRALPSAHRQVSQHAPSNHRAILLQQGL
jgi:hypothetical protein